MLQQLFLITEQHGKLVTAYQCKDDDQSQWEIWDFGYT